MSTTYLYYSGHGDTTAEADASGNRTASHTYDPFGAPVDTVPTNQTVQRFTGGRDKQCDTSICLIQMGARPYDPSARRFWAVDPIEGGSFNGYDYAAQDPINGYDLNGKMLQHDDGGGGKITITYTYPGTPVTRIVSTIVTPTSATSSTTVRKQTVTNTKNGATSLSITVQHWGTPPETTGRGPSWKTIAKDGIQCVAGAGAAASQFPPPWDGYAALGGCLLGIAAPTGSTAPPP
jgi:RHS repeat-associated protein